MKIVSGGQTGVDQGALEAAVGLGLDYGGWAPHGWLAEGGTVPEVYRAKMREMPAESSNAKCYRKRTKANVRDSDATLIIADRMPLEGGTERTREYAANTGKPHHVADLGSADALDAALAWLRPLVAAGSPFVLNVAGPRESKAPGIQQRARDFVLEVTRTVNFIRRPCRIEGRVV